MMLIPLDRITAADHPVRRSRSEGGIEELASSMVKSGQVCPVKVRQVRDHYEVIYGHRRVEAARRADLGCVDAIVEDCDLGDFEPYLEDGKTLKMLRDEDGVNTRMVKAIRKRTDKDGNVTRHIELYDRQKAMEGLARVKAMFVDKQHVTVNHQSEVTQTDELVHLCQTVANVAAGLASRERPASSPDLPGHAGEPEAP